KRGEEAGTPPAHAGGSPTPGLARMAMDAVINEQVKFVPARYANSYLDWLAEKRDWCISRQLWWGHRIPVWSKPVEGARDASDTLQKISPVVPVGGGSILFADVEERWVAQLSPSGNLLVCVNHGFQDIEERLQLAGFLQDPD